MKRTKSSALGLLLAAAASGCGSQQPDPPKSIAPPELVWQQAGVSGGPEFPPWLSVSADGSARLLWTVLDALSGKLRIYTAVRPPQGPWATPELIDTPDFQLADRPHLATDDSGAGFIWGPACGRAWARRLEADGSLGAMARFGPDFSCGTTFELAVASNGTALAVWAQDMDDANRSIASIRAVRFTPGAGWGDVQILASGPNLGQVTPALQFSRNGDAVYVVKKFEGPDQPVSIFAFHYSPSTGWSPAATIANREAEHDELRVRPVLSADSQGRFLVVWRRDGTLGPGPIWRSYEPGVGWSIARSAVWVGDTAALAPGGNGFMVGRSNDAAHVFGLLYDRSRGFADEKTDLNPQTTGRDSYNHELSVDDSGRAFAVWTEAEAAGQFGLWFVTGTSGDWSSAQRIAGTTSIPPISTASRGGSTFTAWADFNGALKIWAVKLSGS